MALEAAQPHRYKALVLGNKGQLGQQLCTDLAAIFEVVPVDRTQADLADPSKLDGQIKALLEQHKPAFVLNAAAYTAVDQAESDVAVALRVNAHAPGVLATRVAESGAILVHYSTDYVFDGRGEQPWRESDLCRPLSVYGACKWLGEQAIKTSLARHLILRTSWVVGEHGGNFLKTMLRLATQRESLSVVADQVGVPTSTRLLTAVTEKLMQKMSDADIRDPRWGVYHVAPSGETNWCSYAKHVLAGATQRGAVLTATADRVTPITSVDYPTAAIRPLNSRLDTQKLRATFGIELPGWQQGVDEILDQLLKKNTR